MDMQLIQLAYQCLSEHYPQIGAAVVQIIGAASVIAALGRGLNVAQTPTAGGSSLLSGLMGLANSIGLNPKK